MSAPALQTPVKHLLVDLDGTLLGNRSFPLSIGFVREALAALKPYGGWRKAVRTLVEIQKEFKRPSSDIMNDVRIVTVFAEHMDVSIEEARRILRESVLLIFPGLRRHFFPVEGAKEFLDWAKDHYPLTLATNPVWPPEIVEMRVKWAGIDPAIFGYITHVRTMHACKPTRQYYEEVCAHNGVKPEDCLLIGDNLKMDLPATQLGIRVFIVGKYHEVKPLRGPKAIAPAWRGPYPALRALLEHSQRPSRR